MFRAPRVPSTSARTVEERVVFGPHRILVAVDESEQASWAAMTAAPLAARFGAELGLVHVVPEATYLGPVEATGELEQHIVRCGEDFLAHLKVDAPPGVRLDRFLREGVAAHEILATARAWRAGLIVIGTHGRRGLERVFLGSTAEAVVRRAQCPVLCVGHKPHRPGVIERVLVAVDSSEQAVAAAQLAFNWARAFSARVALAHIPSNSVPLLPAFAFAGDRAYEAEYAAAKTFLDDFPVPTEIEADRIVVQGPAADGILGASLEWDADLIVIGTHARRGLARLGLGSTAEAVLRRAACPVVCIGNQKNEGAP